MALTATIYNFDVQLSDVDRNVYETLSLRVARHPSETEEYLVTRVLAYCLEYADGIAFSKGIAEPDEPAVVIRDLTGALRVWIEVGSPDAQRLHKASKASPRVSSTRTRIRRGSSNSSPVREFTRRSRSKSGRSTARSLMRWWRGSTAGPPGS